MELDSRVYFHFLVFCTVGVSFDMIFERKMDIVMWAVSLCSL